MLVKKLSNYKYYCQSLGRYTSLYEIGKWIYDKTEVYVEQSGKDITKKITLRALLTYREKNENSKNIN